MIEMFMHYAKCNQKINQEVIRIILEQESNVFDLQVAGFYKSIGDILNHYYVADLIWLHSFKTVREFSIYNHSVFNIPPQFGVKLFNDINEFGKNRLILDEIFIQLINEINNEDLHKTVTRITRTGEKLERSFWKTLMHVFNHQTHHRGKISQILDGLNIENDYSNMIRY